MDRTAPEPDVERLHPEFDAAAVIKVIRRGMRRLSRQIHQGSTCPNPTTCDACDGLVLDGYERVLAAFKDTPGRDGWTPGYIVACARQALPDAVRKRMSRAGLVAKPDRWLGQRSFLPDAPELGRVLVIASVLSVGYFTVIPVANGQAEVTEESLQRLLTGLRCAKGGFASLRHAWRTHGGDAATTAELKTAYRQALDAWRHEDQGGEPVAERGPDVADRLVVYDGADPVRRLRLTRNGTRWSWRRGACSDRVSAPTLWGGNGSGRRITRPGPSRSCFPMTRDHRVLRAAVGQRTVVGGFDVFPWRPKR